MQTWPSHPVDVERLDQLAGWVHAQPDSLSFPATGDEQYGPDVAGMWVLSWRGHGGGGRIDTWIFPDEARALRQARSVIVDALAGPRTGAIPTDGRQAIDFYNQQDRHTRMDVSLATLQMTEDERARLLE